jgi:hypothetical protein
VENIQRVSTHLDQQHLDQQQKGRPCCRACLPLSCIIFICTLTLALLQPLLLLPIPSMSRGEWICCVLAQWSVGRTRGGLAESRLWYVPMPMPNLSSRVPHSRSQGSSPLFPCILESCLSFLSCCAVVDPAPRCGICPTRMPSLSLLPPGFGYAR